MGDPDMEWTPIGLGHKTSEVSQTFPDGDLWAEVCSRRLTAMFRALAVMVGLFFLVACSPARGTAPGPATLAEVPVLLTPSPPQVTAATHTPETPTTVTDRVTSTPSLVASPTQPALAATIPATQSVANSPLPSPTPAADEPSPPVAEVAPGEPAPDFTLEGNQWGSVTLSDYRGASNIVLVFYRGKT
jgi:hypothetical protein